MKELQLLQKYENVNFSDISLNWLLKNGVDLGLKLIMAILIIVIGFWLTSRISRLIIKYLSKSNISLSLSQFMQSILSAILKIFVILIAMNTVGIKTTSLAALLGGLAVGVGLAMQGSLANLAGGLLILFFKPFKVGDFVEALGKRGTVQAIDILQTVLLTPDGQTVFLPNGNVFNNPIINISYSGFRRVEIQVRIDYRDDFDKVKEILLNVLKSEPDVIEEKGFTLEMNEFGENSVDLAMYCYCKTDDFMSVRWKLNRATKKALDDNGFKIPLPQRDLRIVTHFDSEGRETVQSAKD